MPSVEVMGEIKEELSAIDLGFGSLSVSPIPYDSSFGGTDGSSTSMAKSEVSDADHLLSAFNSISIAKSIELTDDGTKACFEPFALESNGNTDLSGWKQDVGNDTGKFDLADLPTVSEPSIEGGIDSDVLVGFGKTSKVSHPRILYMSSRRNTCKLKLNQNNESKEKPSTCGKMARKKTVVDLSSLQILRKNRSSIPQQRSSVWGGWRGIALPFSKDHGVLSLNVGNEKKEKRVRGGKGKKKPVKGQIHRESIEKKCPPAGRISLKIKIGNKLCSMGNATDSCILPGKGITESIGIKENMIEEKVLGVTTLPLERNLDQVPSDACALNKPSDVKTAYDNSCFSTSSDFHSIIGPGECDNLAASIDNLCSDIGTSPDSEVINTVPDVPLCEKGLLDIQTSPVVSNASVSQSDNSSLVSSPRKSEKGVKKGKPHREGNCASEVKLTGVESPNNAEVPLCMEDSSSMSMPQTKFKKGKTKVKMHDLGGSGVKSSRETTNEAEVPADLEMDHKLSEARVNSAKPSLDCPDLFGTIEPSNAEACDMIPCSKGRKTSKSSRAKGGSKSWSKIPDLSSKKGKSSKKKGNKNGVGGSRHSIKEKAGTDDALGKVESLQATGSQTPIDLSKNVAPSSDSTGPLDDPQFSSGVMEQQCMPLRSAWVLCDECEKWRRIPATLCDQIEETNQRWTCKENTDRNYTDCSIPQEKSDSAINEELGISETSWEEDAGGTLQKSIDDRPKACQHSSWSLIKSNLFLHRNRKKQTIDEVMVCHCKPSLDGRLGCGAKCLNRMLNIECVEGTCPCGELCSNQQFQKRNYSKLKWFKCGKKGYGLQALEDICRGQFLIEYVGEVLDVRAYEARQREYALNGHKHFYFMTLNGSEVIDACAKGNLGRFINHSCDPNCRTEKWMVNGEVCIGLFSLRDIKKGEEVTFDYNYVRVFGAAAKKCVCGSPNCRGYIGGDPTNSEVIVQDDSDDEYSEPVMICEDRELNEEWNDIISSSLNGEENEIMHEQTENKSDMEKLLGTVEILADSQAFDSVTQKVEDPAQVAGTVEVDNSFVNGFVEQSEINKECCKSSSGSVLGNLKAKSDDLQSRMFSPELMDISLNTDGSLNKEISSAHESVVTVASPSKSLCDTIESKRKLKYATVGGRDGISKSKSLARTKRSSNSVRKGKPKVNALNDKESSDMDKLNASLHKAKKIPGLSISHFEAVEEKLNELLDPEGGISKRKDASRGYLKLLFLTAASGNNVHGEAIQSNRDLSMILDALLKTKSRSVLVDIINKNGLQMLHNIMKRYRKEFNKTPILRKLLKVLEHLALRHILTSEHITGGPPYPGVESFKDSILSLTEHADKQVHQIARSFRDRWIPRHLRKSCCIERDSGRSEINQHSSHLLPPINRKSDQDGKPSEATNSCEKQPVAAPGKVETSTLDGSSSGANATKTRKRKSRWDNPVAENPHSRTSPKSAGDAQRSIDEDIPPGFASSCNGHPITTDTSSATTNHKEMGMHKLQNPCDVILGSSPLRFNARMPISYGISRSLVQQFGVTRMESTECWAIAPGMPFLPFPPLPPHPHSSGELPAAAAGCAPVSELTEHPEQHNDTSVTFHAGQKRTRTCSVDPPDNNVSVPNGQPDFQQGNGLGRKYFRQQKWNHSKLAPPWVRMRNGWGQAGNNPQNNPPGVGFGMGASGFRNVYNWQETNWRG